MHRNNRHVWGPTGWFECGGRVQPAEPGDPHAIVEGNKADETSAASFDDLGHKGKVRGRV